MTSQQDYIPSYDEIADLQEDIELNVGLLRSLEGDSDTETEESRQVITKTIRRLKKRLKTITQPEHPPDSASQHPEENTTNMRDPDHIQRSPTPSAQVDGPNDDPAEGPSNSFASPTYNLATRKRQRGDFDDDEAGSRSSKSVRPSPLVSAAPSPSGSAAGSVLDGDLDDALFAGLMSKEELEEQRRYMRDIEERQRQERQDEELARTLGDSQDVTGTSSAATFRVPQSPYQSSQPASAVRRISPPAVQRPPQPAIGRPTPPVFQQPPPTFQHPPPRAGVSQAFIRGDGSLRGSGQGMSNQNIFAGPSLEDDFSSGANTPTSSQDSFEEIPANQFVPRMGSALTFGSPAQPAMPGAFPGGAHYTSTAGSSVYGGVSRGGLYIPSSILGNTNMLENMGVRRVMNQFPSYDDIDPAKTQEEIKNLLKHIRPDEELTEEQLKEMPQGLTRPLMPHQIRGLAWMKKQEEGYTKGGILADDMGLGKTVQAIALMLARPAPENDRRPNLIVAPVALMLQWKRELKKFLGRGTDLRNIVLFHGPTRAQQWGGIRNADVVITTYGTLASELKRLLIYEDKLKYVADPASVKEPGSALLGHKSKFHRVFLDEAQNIKNRLTKGAEAACRIESSYRWALSGTPMQNNVEEMYSLIKFCRIRPYNSWEKFSRDIARPLKGRHEAPKERAMRALQALLRALLLRRTKQSKIGGKPILQLPPKTTVEERAIFGKDQREFYEGLERSAQIQFNRYLRNGSIGRNYSNALTLLLRLRQACCSPTLIVNSKDFQQTVSDLAPTDMVANAKLLPKEVVERLKKDSEDETGIECPVCMDACEDPTIFQCGHTICTDCFAKLVDNAMSNEEGSAASCPHCRAKIDANKITNFISFLRVYCPERVPEGTEPLGEGEGDDDLSDSDSSDEDDDSDDGADLADFIVNDKDEVEYDDDDEDQAAKKKSKGKKKKRSSLKGKGKGKAKPAKNLSLAELRKEGLKSRSAKKKYLKRLAKEFVSSTKIDKTIALLEEIHARGEGEKTIVFSSFTSFLDLLEVPLSRHPDLSVYSRYDGSMNSAARNDAVLDFTDKPNNRVILVSLKAGNSGLNLTAANHVIMLDPFWNPFVEYQAADRCYRIGQEREVTVHRVLIGREEGKGDEEGEYTVEDRILKLQEKKKQLVEMALDETAGAQVGRLGVRELGYLFGVNNLD